MKSHLLFLVFVLIMVLMLNLEIADFLLFFIIIII